MSWFGQIAGGLVEGAGKGASEELMLRKRMQAQQELARERAAERQQLQTQRLDQQRELASMREENRRTSRGTGGGESFFDRMLMTAETPQDKQDAIEYTRMRAGDEAAELVAQRFGMGSPARTVDPSRTSVTGYNDATGGMDTAVPASITMPGMSGKAAEAGRVSLNRVLAMASGKFKDFGEGEGLSLVNDAVRGAGGDDTKMRKAGAMAMAVDGKDRIGISDGTQYDKSGVSDSKTTEVGRSKINENNAQAGSARASAGKYRAQTEEIKTGKTAAGEKPATTADLQRKINAARDNLADELGVEKNRVSGELARLKKKANEGDAQAKARLERATPFDDEMKTARRQLLEFKPPKNNGEDTPAPAKPAASAVATPTTKAEFDRLPSGTRFKAPDGSVRVKP